MSQTTNATQAGAGKLSDEITKMEYEPILPIEKKLVGWSIALGAGLLLFLYWLSQALFPTGH